MIRRLSFFSMFQTTGLVGLLLAGCGGNGEYDIAVQKAAYNQTAIQVKKTPEGLADQALIETQGYEEAKDRLLQMDVSRRLGRGTLSEIFGAEALPRDLFIMAIGLRDGVRLKLAAVQAQFPEYYQLLESFSVGVNRFIAEIDTKQPDLLRTYRQLTHNATYTPDKWEPADCLAIAQNISFYLSSAIQEKLTLGLASFAALQAQSGGKLSKFSLLKLPTVASNLVDIRPLENTFILDANAPATKALGKVSRVSAKKGWEIASAALSTSVCKEWGYPLPECHRQPGFGSNNFTISPGFAGGQAAYVANDPHLPLTFPMTFYELSLDSKAAGGTLRMRGVNLPGVPGVLIGHNDDIAWGMTNLTADVDDVYLDMVDDNQTGTFFEVNGVQKVVPFEVKQEVFRIRNANGSLDEKTFPLRVVPNHGPVFSDYLDSLKEPLQQIGGAFGSTMVATYKWTGQQATHEYVAALALDRAHNYTEFKAALSHFGAGAQNVVYADKEGNIGYYAHGNFPVRTYAGTALGRWVPYIPTPGIGKYEWEPKYREQIPELFNPRAGRIVTANNDPSGNTLTRGLNSEYLGYDFADGIRATRITQHLDELRKTRGTITADSLREVQFDHQDLMSLRFIDLLRQAQPKLMLSGDAQAVVDALLAFDGDMNRNRTEPVLVDEYLSQLLSAFVAEYLPVAAQTILQDSIHTTIMIKTCYHKLNDGLAADDPSRALHTLQTAVEAAAKQKAEKHLEQVRWGAVHRIQFTNMLEGLVPSFPLPPLERDGYWETVDVSGPGFGPNFRLIMTVKPGAPIDAIISVPGGNYSADNTKGFYDELLRWRDGRYRDLVPFVQ